MGFLLDGLIVLLFIVLAVLWRSRPVSSALFSLCLSSVAYIVSPIVRSVTVTCGSLSPVIAETICAICAESALV